MIAIGLMSGTSGDGVDAVMIELASAVRRHTPRLLAHVHRPFPAAIRADLMRPDRLSTPRIAELHFELPRHYAEAVRALPRYRRAAVCGMHGQTLFHAPPPASPACTLQIGSSSALAQWIGIPVVGDLRGADVALGGQGAPIVPFAHWFYTPQRESPRIVVNFGGICNLTYVGRRVDEVRAYDVGPGMMLSDAFAAKVTGGRMACDRDGALSRRGGVVPALVEAILAHPFMARRPPKSTGREEFGRPFFDKLMRRFGRLPRADVARSLLAATARVLRDSVKRDAAIVKGGYREVLLSGGGALNPVLVDEVRACFADTKVSVASAGVFAPEHHEPSAMALFAARTMSRLPSTLPGVTGARAAAIAGHVCWPSDRKR
jgi:anhydro-N-acetylmuramic acid kinase